jgi:uncharacterized membrane protein YhhN
MSLESALILISAATAIVYGTLLVARGASLVRTIVKTLAVAALAGVAFVDQAPWPLIAALGLSAFGDALLADESPQRLPFGLAAFLIAHLAYIALFAHDGGGRYALLAEPWRNLGVGGAMAAGAAMLIWLWSGLGPLKPAVAAYAVALAAMAGFAFTLPYWLWPAMAGAVAFIGSDALLSAQLFKGLKSRAASVAVWWLYYTAQALILWAYLR